MSHQASEAQCCAMLILPLQLLNSAIVSREQKKQKGLSRLPFALSHKYIQGASAKGACDDRCHLALVRGGRLSFAKD